MKLLLVMMASLWTASALAADAPAKWRDVLRDDPSTLWEWCHSHGKFYPGRVIAVFRQGNSRADGDAAHHAAMLLSSVESDPQEALRFYLRSPDPYDRVFALWIIDILGDPRLLPEVRTLTKDGSDVSEWWIPGGKISTFAQQILEQFTEHKWTPRLGKDWPDAQWLLRARKTGT